MDVQNIIEEILPCISYGAGLAVILGLSEWLVCFFLRAVFDRFGTRRL